MTPFLCRYIGHKWPRSVLGDAYSRVGSPTYWTVRSACQRPGCIVIREAELAGVNPRFGIPWGPARERQVEDVPCELDWVPGTSAGKNRRDTRLW